MFLDIGEVALRSGVPASTLRYYESKGLIVSAGRHGLRRQFDARVLDKLALIALGRAAGFSLGDIAGMFTSKGELCIDRPLLIAKADDIDEKIRQLTILREGLRHVAVCPKENHLECETFRRIMRAASTGVIAPLVELLSPRGRTDR